MMESRLFFLSFPCDMLIPSTPLTLVNPHTIDCVRSPLVINLAPWLVSWFFRVRLGQPTLYQPFSPTDCFSSPYSPNHLQCFQPQPWFRNRLIFVREVVDVVLWVAHEPRIGLSPQPTNFKSRGCKMFNKSCGRSRRK